MHFNELEMENIKNLIIEYMLETTSKQSINLWFMDLRLVSIDDSSAIFVSPSNFKKKIIISHFKDKLRDAIKEILGFELDVIINSSENGEVDISAIPKEENTNSNFSTPKRYNEKPALDIRKPEYTFENFVVGASNRLAYSASVAVANNEKSANVNYNPLFIYGPSGVGKSHLLYAITNHILDRNPNLNIKYISGEEFFNQLNEAIQKKTQPAFREKFRNVNVLLIDDIHILTGRESSQEEVFNTFNAIYREGNQIILTSDRPPNEMHKLEDRLRTRFMSGLIADIQLPDFDLKCAIIKQKSSQNGLHLSQDIIVFLAENIKSSIRQLEGVVKKLGAIQLLEGGEITLDRVKNSIKEFIQVTESDTKRMDKIFIAVCKKYGVSREDILSDSRISEIMMPRHICVYLARTCTNLSQEQIGKAINRERTTIISSEKKVKSLIESDPSFALDINELVRQIKS